MAKAKDNEATSLSEETLQGLDGVRRGKPRRFVLISQGAQIVSLVVYKKGALDKRLKEARESGRGKVSYGIVEGQGVNLTFKLAKADGFEDAPVRDTALKSFLSDEADLSCKPTFEIVETLPPLADDDLPPGTQPPTQPETAQVQTDQPQSDDARAAEFRTRLAVIKVKLKELRGLPSEAARQQADEAAALAKQAGGLAQENNYEAALKLMDHAERIANAPLQPTTQKPAGSPRAIWLAAKDEIDDQLGKLQLALRAFKEPRLERIAEMGLHGITDKRQVSLVTAINEFESAPPAGRQGPARDKLLSAVKSFAEFVATDPIVALCDKNPFGIPVAIRGTLGKALGDIRAAIAG